MSSDDRIRLDFLVLGAQKAGTTTLHDWLAAHPLIALPTFKETHFFSHTKFAARGTAWYLRQFTEGKDEKFIGEIDPEYLFAPSAPDLIAAKTTANKFIILLRHPLERALSQYLMSLRRGYERRSFAEALELESVRLQCNPKGIALDHHSYISRSLYTEQIVRYRKRFPEGAFLFLRSDELNQEGYERICHFIGVPSATKSVDFGARSNIASTAKSGVLRDALYAPEGKSALRRLIVKAIPRSVKRRIFLTLDQMNQKPAEHDKSALLGSAPKESLAALLDDIDRLMPVVNLDLSDWRDDIARRLEA